MVRKPNLSPEKKKQLKKDVLEELSPQTVKKTKDPIVAKASKASVPTTKTISPAVKTKPVGNLIKKSYLSSPKIKSKPIVEAAVLKTSTTPKAVKKSPKTKTKLKTAKPAPQPQISSYIEVPKPKIELKSAPAVAVKEKAINFNIDSTETKKIKKNHLGLKMVGFIILVLIMLIAIDLFGLYRLGWKDGLSFTVAKAMSLPAGMVDNNVIKMADYLDDVKILQLAVAQKREGVTDDLASLVKDNKFSDKIFNRLAAIAVIDGQLKKYKLNVSDDNITSAITNLINQAGGRSQTETIIQNLYGLNLSQFGEKILKPLIARDMLQEAIVKDESLEINKNAKAKAQDILQKALQPGADFGSLAHQYTEDEAGINTNGDLGWIKQGELSPEIDKILFAMSSSTVYNQLIANKLGYHIIKVEEISKNPDDGKVTIKAKQILIKVDIDQYIKSLLDKAKIKKFVK